MNLTKYVDDLNTAYKKNRSTWEALQNSLADVKAEQLSVKNSASSEARKAADVEELQDKEKDLNNQLKELQESAIAEFDEIDAEYDAAIKEFFTAKPADVDEAGALLLNSGALTDADLCALVREYPENATMLKLISKEAEERDSSTAKALKAYLDAFITSNERSEEFKGALLTVYRALNPGRGLADPNNEYWTNELYQKLKDKIAGLEKLDLEAMDSFVGV